MQLIDPSHPIYRPLWVRIIIVLVCLGWCIGELFFGDPLWAMLSGAAGLYSAYLLLLTYKPPVETPLAETPLDEEPPAEDMLAKTEIEAVSEPATAEPPNFKAPR